MRTSVCYSHNDLVQFTKRNPRMFQRNTRDSRGREDERFHRARRRTIVAQRVGRPHYLRFHPLSWRIASSKTAVFSSHSDELYYIFLEPDHRPTWELGSSPSRLREGPRRSSSESLSYAACARNSWLWRIKYTLCEITDAKSQRRMTR